MKILSCHQSIVLVFLLYNTIIGTESLSLSDHVRASARIVYTHLCKYRDWITHTISCSDSNDILKKIALPIVISGTGISFCIIFWRWNQPSAEEQWNRYIGITQGMTKEKQKEYRLLRKKALKMFPECKANPDIAVYRMLFNKQKTD